MLFGLRLATLFFGLPLLVVDLLRSAVGLWPLAFGRSPFAVCGSCGVGVGDDVGVGIGAFDASLTRGGKKK